MSIKEKGLTILLLLQSSVSHMKHFALGLSLRKVSQGFESSLWVLQPLSYFLLNAASVKNECGKKIFLELAQVTRMNGFDAVSFISVNFHLFVEYFAVLKRKLIRIKENVGSIENLSRQVIRHDASLLVSVRASKAKKLSRHYKRFWTKILIFFFKIILHSFLTSFAVNNCNEQSK